MVTIRVLKKQIGKLCLTTLLCLLFLWGATAVAAEDRVAGLVCEPGSQLPVRMSFGQPMPILAVRGEMLSLPIKVQNYGETVNLFPGALVAVLVPESEIVGGLPVSPLDFFVVESIPVLLPGAEADVSFDWAVPTSLPDGEYRIVFHHESGNPASAYARSFTDIIGIGSLTLSVSGGAPISESAVGEIVVSGASLLDSGAYVIDNPLDRVSLRADISSPDPLEALTGQVTWELYRGPAPAPAAWYRSEKKDIRLLPEQTEELEFTLPPFTSGVVTIIMSGSLSSGESFRRTFHVLRAPHELSYEMPRIQFAAFTETQLLACVNLGDVASADSIGFSTTDSPYTVRISSDGAFIHQSEHAVPERGASFALVTAPWQPTAAGLAITLLQAEKPVAEVTLPIDCASFPCAKKPDFPERHVSFAENTEIIFYLLFTLASLLLALLVIRRLPIGQNKATSGQTVTTVPTENNSRRKRKTPVTSSNDQEKNNPPTNN